jgi:hypothetical protein
MPTLAHNSTTYVVPAPRETKRCRSSLSEVPLFLCVSALFTAVKKLTKSTLKNPLNPEHPETPLVPEYVPEKPLTPLCPEAPEYPDVPEYPEVPL